MARKKEYKKSDIVEFIIAMIDEFAKSVNLSEEKAFRYLNAYNGIDFLEKNYGIMHTLDFKDCVEGLRNYCRRKGGKL